jgi:hypothetical protein
MKLGEPQLTQTYRIFLSSGDDALDLRDRVDGLVYQSINPQLIEARQRVRFEVDRWERTVAHRTPPDEDTIKQFVDRAVESNMTLALLMDALDDGTRAELQGVLETDKELNALWFIPRTCSPDTPVAQFLTERGDELYYDKTGYPDTKESWEGIVRILARALIEALTAPPERLDEQR